MDVATSHLKPRVLVIAGPTAVGKTGISILVAKALNGEIISADSAAVYRGLDVGAAKIRPPQMQGVPHHGIDWAEPSAPFSVADFQWRAGSVIQDILARGHLPIIVGGTGLWIRALIRDYRLPEQSPPSPLRDHLDAMGKHYGFASLQRQLRVVDPQSYQAIDGRDHRRLVRALEVFMTSGQVLPRSTSDSPYRATYWVLTRTVSDLHERIRERAQAMLDGGLVDEVRALLAEGVPKTAQSFTAIGYKETLDWLYGRLTDEERDRLIIRHTQQFAKRQLTWFRAEKQARWIDLSAWPVDAAVDKIVQSMREG